MLMRMHTMLTFSFSTGYAIQNTLCVPILLPLRNLFHVLLRITKHIHEYDGQTMRNIL